MCVCVYIYMSHISIRQYVSIHTSSIRSAYVSIRQHTSAYVSIRQHTSAYVSIRQHTSAYGADRMLRVPHQPRNALRVVRLLAQRAAYVSIRQHTSAYVSIRQHIHTSAYVSIRQRTVQTVCSVSHISPGMPLE
jgi:hypothetical protein